MAIYPDPCLRWTLNLYTVVVHVLFIGVFLYCLYTLIYCGDTDQNEALEFISDVFFGCAVVGIFLLLLCFCGPFIPP